MPQGSGGARASKPTGLDAVIGRALREDAFRERMLSDPDAVAREYNLLPQELITLKNIGRETANEFFSKVSGGRAVMFCTSKTCNETG